MNDVNLQRERLECKRRKARDGGTDGEWDEQQGDRERKRKEVREIERGGW